MTGECFNFAVALHRLFGHQLVVLYGERELGIDDPEMVCIHAGILKDDGIVDYDGLKGNPDNLLEHYKSINEFYDHTEIMNFEIEEEFWELVSLCGGRRNESIIKAALDHIQNNLSVYS